MDSKRVLISTSYLEAGGPVDRELREAGLETVFRPHLNRLEPGQSLGDLVGDVDAIIAGTEPFTADLFDVAPRLRIVSRTGVGYDSVDVQAASERGIAVTATPGANSTAVAEMTMALLAGCARHIPLTVAEVRAGEWIQHSGRELRGATLGVIGFGGIGRAVAAIAQGFGMTVVATDPYLPVSEFAKAGATSATLDELLATSDFVTIHIFLDDSTRNLIGRENLAKMKSGAILINAARGGIVDEEALADAIGSGHLAAAALDVVETEPLPSGSRLRAFDNVIVTPHVAGATNEARERSSMMAAHQVIAHLEGREAPHIVNAESLALSAGNSR